jgi:hypothetical protein
MGVHAENETAMRRLNEIDSKTLKNVSCVLLMTICRPCILINYYVFPKTDTPTEII